MSNRTIAPRTVLVALAFLLVAAAAVAGMRWRNWTPANACLFCATPEPDATLTASASAQSGTTAGTSGTVAAAPNGRMAGGEFTAGSGSSATSARQDPSAGSGRSKPSGARRGWQPWGTASGSFRSYSGNSGAPSSSLGGLWRLMSLTRSGSAGAANGVVASNQEPRTAVRPPTPPAAGTKPTPPAPPAGATPAPPAPAPPTTPDGRGDPVAPSAPAPPPATDPFHEHDKPLPDPFGGPPPSGPLDPGGPGGSGPGGLPGGDPSPTPEPSSILLIGTGLAGIMGALRRRGLL